MNPQSPRSLSLKLLTPVAHALLCLVLFLAGGVVGFHARPGPPPPAQAAVQGFMDQTIDRLDADLAGLSHPERRAAAALPDGGRPSPPREWDNALPPALGIGFGPVNVLLPRLADGLEQRLASGTGILAQAGNTFDQLLHAPANPSRILLGGLALGLFGVVVCLVIGLWFSRGHAPQAHPALYRVGPLPPQGQGGAKPRSLVHEEGNRLLLAMARMQAQLRAVVLAQSELAILQRQAADAVPGPASLPEAQVQLGETVAGLRHDLRDINDLVRQLADATPADLLPAPGSVPATRLGEKLAGLEPWVVRTDARLTTFSAALSAVLRHLAPEDHTAPADAPQARVFARIREDADALAGQLGLLAARLHEAGTELARGLVSARERSHAAVA